MACKHIIEDSTFVISLMNAEDRFHTESLEIFKKILSCPNDIKVVVPSTVFYETMCVLLKNGIHYRVAKEKLMKLIMIDQIINHAITETAIIKMGIYVNKLLESQPEKEKTRSNDLMILSVAMSYENSCLLTADVGIKKYSSIFKDIFCFQNNEEREKFIEMINDEGYLFRFLINCN